MMANSSTFPSLVFFGNERLATGVTTKAPTLNALLKAGYPIEAVIVNQQQATSRKQRALEVEQLAASYSIPIYRPTTKAELEDVVKTLHSPVAVLAAFGKMVPGTVINHFAHGILNIHPSALPKYRGSTPLESVILDGSESTAVSLMQLDVKMDAGAVFAQNDIVLQRTISKQQLADTAGELGATMLLELLPQIITGTISARPQDESQATITNQISKPDGTIDWTKSAKQLEREIRAFWGWPGSATEVNGKSIIVAQAQVMQESGTPGTFFIHDKQLAAYCGHDALLITRLKPVGKNDMSSRDYLRGNPISG